MDNPLAKYKTTNPLEKYKTIVSEEKSNPLIDIITGGVGIGGGLLAGRKLAREIPKQTGSIMRRLSGINTSTVKQLKEIGPQNVLTQRYKPESFIADTLVPETKKTFLDIIKKEGENYGSVINQVDRTSYMDLNNTRQALQEIFDELGPAATKGKTFSDTGLKKLADMLDDINTQGAMPRVTVDILRDNVGDIFKTIPDRNNILATKVKDALIKDYEVAGASGLGQASKSYKKVFDIAPYTDESKLNAFLSRGASQKSGSLTERALKELVPDNAESIISELRKYKIAQQFQPNSKLYPSRAGITSGIARPVLSGYYKNIYPGVQKIKGVLKKLKGVGKTGISALGTVGMLTEGMGYLNDPVGATAQSMGIELAPKGSIERQFQLEQIT